LPKNGINMNIYTILCAKPHRLLENNIPKSPLTGSRGSFRARLLIDNSSKWLHTGKYILFYKGAPYYTIM
jgi:hypothetical protein